MKGINYLKACLQECNKNTIVSFGSYNCLFKTYEKNEHGVVIYFSDSKEMFFGEDEKVFSEFDDKFNSLDIKL